MRSQYRIYWDGDSLDLTSPNIRGNHAAGNRIIWVREGAQGVIPDAVLDDAFRLYDDFRARLRTTEAVPAAVGQIEWAQVVQVYGDGSRGHGPVTLDT